MRVRSVQIPIDADAEELQWSHERSLRSWSDPLHPGDGQRTLHQCDPAIRQLPVHCHELFLEILERVRKEEEVFGEFQKPH